MQQSYTGVITPCSMLSGFVNSEEVGYVGKFRKKKKKEKNAQGKLIYMYYQINSDINDTCVLKITEYEV